MATLDLMAAVSGPLILAMIWLRTRVQYASRGSTLHLQRAGWFYFGAALALMGLGWLVAPLLGAVIWPAGNLAAPTLLRVVWFLATYYLFILVHRFIKAKTPVYTVTSHH